jgi:hypothetical protein
MNEYVVPDSTGDPLRAWRTWFVVPKNRTSGELRLRSFVYSRVWEIGEPQEASCNLENHTHTTTPDENCSCGLYGVTDKTRLDRYYRDRYSNSGTWLEIYRVRGEVALWGKVFPGEYGYRAQYAYPVHIEVPARIKGRERLLSAKEVAASLEHYGCTTEVTDDELDLRGRGY